VLLGTAGATVLIPLVALVLAAFGLADKGPLNVFFLLAADASAFMGAALGLSQWWVLREVTRTMNPWAWIAATAGGGLFVWTLILLPEIRAGAHAVAAFSPVRALGEPQLLATALFLGSIFGAILGTAQWAVLRNYLAHAGWWISGVALAGAVGLPFVVLALSRAEKQATYGGFWLVGTLGGLAAGVLCAGITGISLVRLRNAQGSSRSV
jgi:hypothetical protein